MEQKEYQLGQAQQRPMRGPMGGRHGPGGMARGGEKPKNLVGTWKKLLAHCKQYRAVMAAALVCAVLGTVLTLMGPDRLSAMTEVITAGVTPDTEVLADFSQAVGTQMSENLAELAGKIGQNLASPAPRELTYNGVTLSVQDQAEGLTALSAMSGEENGTAALDTLPAPVYQALFSDLTFAGTVYSAGDQQKALDIFSQLGELNSETDLSVLDDLPESVAALVAPGIDLSRVRAIALGLIVMYLLSAAFSGTQSFIMATVTQKISRGMRRDIVSKINRLPMRYFQSTTTGDILSRVTNDVDTIGQSLSHSLGNLIAAVILFLGSLVMMLLTDGIMTLTAVCASLLGFAIMMAIMSRSQKYFARQQKHLGEINGHIEEIFAGHTVVKAYNGETAAQNTFDRMNRDLCESGFRAQCLSGLMMPVMGFIGNLGYVAVCVVGGALALNGKIGFGVIVAFMMYVRYFTQPLSQMAQAVQNLQSAAAAGERVFAFLEAEEMPAEPDARPAPAPIRGEVAFDHVRFTYPGSAEPVIRDFSARTLPGQKVAIVGPTGAGKTTMVNLLMRFYELQGGEIRIDGVPTRDMSRETVHSLFCMVLQDTWLFQGTLRENLVYCAENVTQEQMEQACRAVGLDKFIRTLPQGYDTVLNDQVNLSQGQKQQLTIARAMISGKPMLILDEATSSVDTRTEQQIQAAMDRLMENRTSFVIAHRLSTIRNADLILVMKHGDIIESGTHETLLAQGGFYAELYNSQFDQAS